MHKVFCVFLLLIYSFSYANQQELENNITKEEENLDEEYFKHFKNFAKVQVLNKITAKSVYVDIKVGDEKSWEFIKIKVNACWQSSPYELTENKILLDIYEKKTAADDYLQVFYGWMFSSSPAISTMENAIYDVVAINCYD